MASEPTITTEYEGFLDRAKRGMCVINTCEYASAVGSLYCEQLHEGNILKKS